MKNFLHTLTNTSLSLTIIIILSACIAQDSKQNTSASTLSDNHSSKLTQIRSVANQGPFKPEWDSLANYKIPAWYQDAKFGIFIHWGVYSVPAHNGEWYPRKMYKPEHEEYAYHQENYGKQTEFGYKNFIPMFKAEKFNAKQWLSIIKNSGAKYIVPVAEHHDGFSMYDNSYSKWDAVEMGPKRDVIQELKDATKGTGIHFGLSSHRAENWWFFDGGRATPSDVQNDKYRDLYGPAVDRTTSENGQTPPSQEFMDDWLLRTVEIVDKYEPELIWFDWWIAAKPFHNHVKQFASYYYNKGVSWENMPALNYKENDEMRSFPAGSAVLDIERGGVSDIEKYFWQTDTSVSTTSWGYVTNHKYRDANSLVDDLMDIISKNGSLLLNIGPKPDGTIPEPEVALLGEIGDWLKINGEAVYNTRPWKMYGEGSTHVVDGRHDNDAEKHRTDFNSSDIRFTQNGDNLYATILAWPGDNKTVTIRSVNPTNVTSTIKSVQLLGYDGKIEFLQTMKGLVVTLPASSPSKHAQVLKIQL
jgi:alpha-L-fucosidase